MQGKPIFRKSKAEGFADDLASPCTLSETPLKSSKLEENWLKIIGNQLSRAGPAGIVVRQVLNTNCVQKSLFSKHHNEFGHTVSGMRPKKFAF